MVSHERSDIERLTNFLPLGRIFGAAVQVPLGKPGFSRLLVRALLCGLPLLPRGLFQDGCHVNIIRQSAMVLKTITQVIS